MADTTTLFPYTEAQARRIARELACKPEEMGPLLAQISLKVCMVMASRKALSGEPLTPAQVQKCLQRIAARTKALRDSIDAIENSRASLLLSDGLARSGIAYGDLSKSKIWLEEFRNQLARVEKAAAIALEAASDKELSRGRQADAYFQELLHWLIRTYHEQSGREVGISKNPNTHEYTGPLFRFIEACIEPFETGLTNQALGKAIDRCL